jgi:hypothetical protein
MPDTSNLLATVSILNSRGIPLTMMQPKNGQKNYQRDEYISLIKRVIGCNEKN